MQNIGGGNLYMKKKAFYSLALAAMLTSAFAFTACGDNDDQGGTEPEEPVTWDHDAPAYGAEADVTFSVQAKKTNGEEGKISKSLFGVFLEDINYASYYLTADLIDNGSFNTVTVNGSADQKAKKSWGTFGGATFEIKTDKNGIFSDTPAYKDKSLNLSYARVATGAAEGGLRNTNSVLPFAVQEGTDYIFSAFIKNTGAAFDMTVRLTDGQNSYLEETVEVLQNNDWVKYTRRITATGTKSSGLSFDLRFPANTEAFLDGVSLVTTDSTIGIKNTPFNAIKDLSPKFIRFPGGCIIEGNSQMGQECAYDWKNSIGAVQSGNNAGDDVVPAFGYKENTDGTIKEVTTYGEAVTRKPNPDLWALWDGSGYRNYYDMTYAVGFFEYFLLCESVGASAVPVVNCGLSCQGGGAANPIELNGRHNQKIADYIQDAIDLMEFAKGDVTTKWGKIRADMGHPEPFEMDYLGVGNEQYGIYYTKYYEKFLEDDAFMNALAKYSVKPIVGNGMFIGDCERPNESGKLTGGLAKAAAESYLRSNNDNRKIDSVSQYGVVDQHYYVKYPELLEHHDMYDSYLRYYDDEEKYYEVFVGEYSANGEGITAGYDGYTKYKNNEWICALSEAAMMTGYERNGDIVKLAAYAPMFGTAAALGASGLKGNQWATDMMYFTNTDLVLSTNYYVQQLFMKNQGAYRILSDYTNLTWRNGLSSTFELAADTGSSVKRTVNKLYYVASLAENGDVIVKIVNVSGETIKADIALSDFTFKGNASVTVLQCDDRTAKNTLTDTNIEPVSYKIGAFGESTLGYEIKPYSVTSITVHAK